jgi:hypothetical protein
LAEKDNSTRLLNALVAYPYMKPDMVRLLDQHKRHTRFLLDSGAFTAWKAGKPIKLDDYCRFIESLPFEPWRYFTLDVIGDPHGTMKNYETMLKRGFNPVPIFTRGEDLSVLDDFYKTSDVVGLGGLVGTAGNKGFVNGIMKKVNGRRVHWLGFTSLEFIKHYRPYMCDSSSWESGARFAAFHLYLGNGRTKLIKKADFARRPSDEIARCIRSYGLDPADFATSKHWDGGYSHNRRLNGFSAVRMSLGIQENLKTLMFLALTTQHAYKILLEGFRLETNADTAKLEVA